MHPARTVLLPGIFFGAAIASGCAPARAAYTSPAPVTDIAVYALSGGEGVPAGARQALSTARALFAKWGAEGRVLDLVDTPVGFEGDTRLCARFATSGDATSALKELGDLGRDIDLFQVKAEPCAAQLPRKAQ
jgi:hypothetical protein